MTPHETLLDESDVAEILRVSKRKVAALVRANEIPFIELPAGEVRFVRSQIWEWVEARKAKAGEAGR